MAEFPLGGATAASRVFAPTYHRGTYRLGPLREVAQEQAQGLLLFETDVHELRGVKLPGAADIDYAGPGSPISRLDVHGTMLYVGRTDGLLTAVDLTSARRHYYVEAGGFGFGATLEAGSRVVLQTTEEIMVVETRSPSQSGADGPQGEGHARATEGDSAAGNVTLVTQYGTATANADLVAVRDGSGPWRQLEGQDGNYTFEVERGSYSLAVLCFEESGREITLYNFLAAELRYLRHACAGRGNLLTEFHELHGGVRGLQLLPARPFHLLDVAFGSHSLGRYLPRPGAPSYSLMTGREAGDLVAIRTPAGQPPDRAIFMRGLKIEKPTQIDLDFLGPDAISLKQYEVQSEGAAPGALVRVQLRTCNGVVARERGGHLFLWR